MSCGTGLCAIGACCMSPLVHGPQVWSESGCQAQAAGLTQAPALSGKQAEDCRACSIWVCCVTVQV